MRAEPGPPHNPHKWVGGWVVWKWVGWSGWGGVVCVVWVFGCVWEGVWWVGAWWAGVFVYVSAGGYTWVAALGVRLLQFLIAIHNGTT